MENLKITYLEGINYIVMNNIKQQKSYSGTESIQIMFLRNQ